MHVDSHEEKNEVDLEENCELNGFVCSSTIYLLRRKP